MAHNEELLDHLVAEFHRASYAESTKASYRAQLASYVQFCKSHGYAPLPAAPLTVHRYIAYLSLTHKYGSIVLYLNIIRLLHLEAGLPNPLNDFATSRVLKGLKRIKKDTPCRKPAITRDILRSFCNTLNMNNSMDATFWAACLLAFYGMLRISSLFPPSTNKLLISAATVLGWGIVVRISYSKTIQCNQRAPFIALPWNKDKSLCAATALLRAWQLARASSSSHPLLPVMCRGVLSSLP